MKKISLFLFPLIMLSSCTGLEPKELEAIKITEFEVTLKLNETHQLAYEGTPKKFKEVSFSWESSDESIVTVSNTGLLTAIAEGSSVITLSTSNGLSDSITAFVTDGSTILNFSVSPEHQSDVSLANPLVEAWYDDFYAGGSQMYQGKGDIYYPKDLELSWDLDIEAAYYQVKVGTKTDLSDAKNYITIGPKLTLKDLFIGTDYYWKISAYNAKEELLGKSTLNTFHTKDYPRTITIDGVSNSRDIGGKNVAGGKRIKQGMVYRSAHLDAITDLGKHQAIYNYGIKTDIDLRGGSGTTSPIGSSIKYIPVQGCYWIDGDNGLNVESNFRRMYDELKPFTDVTNYPIAFHCAIGQDRTGSLAFVLGALLGASAKDLLIDYELSSFSSAVWDPNAPIWVEDKLKYQYMPLYNYIDSLGTLENTLQEKAEIYVKKVGLTDNDIQLIRDILLED